MFEGSLGGAHRGTECRCQQGHLQLLIGYSHSQHHVTQNGMELSSGSVPLKRLMLIHWTPPPFFFRRAPFLMSHLFVFALGVDVSLSSAADVDVLAAGTVLSLFTFSLHKQGGEGNASVVMPGTSGPLSCGERH